MNQNIGMDTSQYPLKMHWLAVSPVVAGLIGVYLDAISVPTISAVYVILQLLAAVGLLTAYHYQHRFLSSGYAGRLKHQKIFILSAFTLPIVAAILGDLHGQATFGLNASSSNIVFYTISFALYIGIIAIEICALGNVFFILTKGTNNILAALGIIVRILAWLFILFVTYMAYGLAYSLRDPNTE